MQGNMTWETKKEFFFPDERRGVHENILSFSFMNINVQLCNAWSYYCNLVTMRQEVCKPKLLLLLSHFSRVRLCVTS